MSTTTAASKKPSQEWWQKAQKIVWACNDSDRDWDLSVTHDFEQGFVSMNGCMVARLIPNIQVPSSIYLYPRASVGSIEIALLSANLARNFKILIGDPFEYDEDGFSVYGSDAEAMAAQDSHRLFIERTGREPLYTPKKLEKSFGATIVKTPPPRLIN